MKHTHGATGHRNASSKSVDVFLSDVKDILQYESGVYFESKDIQQITVARLPLPTRVALMLSLNSPH
jgi:hypothetical protein